jgi:hypothetical protein
LILRRQIANGVPSKDRCCAFIGKAFDHVRPYRVTVRDVNDTVPLIVTH